MNKEASESVRLTDAVAGAAVLSLDSGLFWAVTEGVTGRRWGDGIKDSIPFSGILTTSRL